MEGRPQMRDRVKARIDHRIRNELNATFVGIARRAGIDQSSLHNVRHCKDGVSEEMRVKVDQALEWPVGTIRRMMDDPAYDPPVEKVAPPERLDKVEREVVHLKGEFDRLAAGYEQIAQAQEEINERLRQLLDGDSAPEG